MEIKIKFCLILYFMLVFCLGFNIISQGVSTEKIYLSANKEIVEKEEEMEITLSIKDVKTTAFTAHLYFDDSKVEYISGPDNTNVVENQIIFVWYDNSGGNQPKEGELAKFYFKAKDEGITNFNITGEFYSQAREAIEESFGQIQVQIGKGESKLKQDTEQGTNLQKNNAKLQSLRLDREGMTPSFEQDIYEYYLTISSAINDIEVLAVSENPNASVEVEGNSNLKEGLNAITIKVISDDKTQSNLYTIHVTKTNNPELANTNLETLAIENALLNPPFDTNITDYEVEVSNETENLNILAIPENEHANTQILGNDSLKEGKNSLKIIVTAQNGLSQKIYKINAYRRNKDEEIQYEEEQALNKENLKEIYQEQEEQKNKEQDKIESQEEGKNKKQNYAIWIIGTVIIVGITIFLVQKFRAYFV